MRDLAIAYGNSRQAKKWVNKTIKFEDLKNHYYNDSHLYDEVLKEFHNLTKSINHKFHIFFL